MYKLLLSLLILAFCSCASKKGYETTFVHDTITQTKTLHDSVNSSSFRENVVTIHDTTFCKADTVFRFVRIYTQGSCQSSSSESTASESSRTQSLHVSQNSLPGRVKDSASKFNVLTISFGLVIFLLVVICFVLKFRKKLI